MILEFYLTINGQSKVINIMVLFETGHFTLKSRFLAPIDKNPEIHGWSLEHINKQVYILQLMTALMTHYDYTWAVFLPEGV